MDDSSAKHHETMTDREFLQVQYDTAQTRYLQAPAAMLFPRDSRRGAHLSNPPFVRVTRPDGRIVFATFAEMAVALGMHYFTLVRNRQLSCAFSENGPTWTFEVVGK